MKKLLRLVLFAAVLKAGYDFVQKRRAAGPLPDGAPFTPATVPTRTTQPQVVPTTRADATRDDLTRVKGIGPVYAQKLADLNITDFDALAAADVAAVAESLSVPESTVTDWQDQAVSLRR